MALDPRRVADIAQKMYGAVCGANGAMNDQDDAKKALDAAKENLTSTREVIMGTVAELSSMEQWTDAEVKAAAKAAGEMHNDKGTASAVKTFINDCQRAAHPLVRDRFDEISDIVNTVWQSETEQKALDSDTPTPVRKLFKRRYHAVLGAFKLVIDQVNPIMSGEDLTKYAIANDPDFDHERVGKLLAKMAEQLSAIAADFPMFKLTCIAGDLASIEPNDLRDARVAKQTGKAVAEPKPATTVATAPHPFKKPTPATKPVAEKIEAALNDADDAAARQAAAMENLMGDDDAHLLAEAA